MKISIFWPKISLKTPENDQIEVVGHKFLNPLYAQLNSISKIYRDERPPPIDFSNASYIANDSFSDMPEKRHDISKSTRNSLSFFSANELTPNSKNPPEINIDQSSVLEPAIPEPEEYDDFLPAGLQSAVPPSFRIPPSSEQVDSPSPSKFDHCPCWIDRPVNGKFNTKDTLNIFF